MNRKTPFALILLAGLMAPAIPPSAQDHDMSMMGKAKLTPAAEAYMLANDQMMADMAIDFTGDPDIDFALQMIPHHQGAIDMARVELDYGKDPEMRALAEAVIAAQTAEIAALRKYLKSRGQ